MICLGGIQLVDLSLLSKILLKTFPALIEVVVGTVAEVSFLWKFYEVSLSSI